MTTNWNHPPSAGGNPNWSSDVARLNRNWRAVTFELDVPGPSRLERMLRRLGFPGRVTRVALATPALRRAWYLAIGLAMLFSVLPFDGPQSREDLRNLLIFAPLVPVLGVTLAYGVEADPAHETALATPMRGLRLILTRTIVVLAISIAALMVVALLAPASSALAFAWLIPSFALTGATLALMTYRPPRQSATITTVLWVLGTVIFGAQDPLAAFTLAGQIVMGLIAGIAAVIIWSRREQFDRLAVRA